MDRNSRPTNDYRFIREPRGGLTITNVMLEDDGKWQCEAKNARGYSENARPVKLIVLGKCYIYIRFEILCKKDDRTLDPYFIAFNGKYTTNSFVYRKALVLLTKHWKAVAFCSNQTLLNFTKIFDEKGQRKLSVQNIRNPFESPVKVILTSKGISL